VGGCSRLNLGRVGATASERPCSFVGPFAGHQRRLPIFDSDSERGSLSAPTGHLKTRQFALWVVEVGAGFGFGGHWLFCERKSDELGVNHNKKDPRTFLKKMAMVGVTACSGEDNKECQQHSMAGWPAKENRCMAVSDTNGGFVCLTANETSGRTWDHQIIRSPSTRSEAIA
jgi:hypothetical protein